VQELLRSLPRDTDAAFFLTLHIGPDAGTHLARSLQDSASIPVKIAEDGEPVHGGTMYFAPSGHHLLVVESIVRLGRGPRENLARPAIDPLFRSVGACYGGGAVGILLSGMLNDGASGLADLKRCGGITIVQGPADAIAPEMPLGALQTSEVDYRAPASQIGEIVLRLLAEQPHPHRAVPAEILLEIDIALGRPCGTSDIATLADPVPLSCPSCGGVLSQLRSKPLRFRCQVGHGFTAEVLAQEQEGSIDEALRVALRIVEERADLVNRLGRQSAAQGRSYSACDFERKAEELRGHAEVLRRTALKAL
jgi:two-component system chemotaxis response regulator CheB